MNFLVTSADHNAYTNMLVPFIASTIENAKFTPDNIIVIDLGLTAEEVKKLNDLNIRTYQRANEFNSIVCDRFSTLAKLVSSLPANSIIAHYDCDVWFADTILDAFANYQPGKLVATVDRNVQGFITGVIPDKNVRTDYDKILKSVKEKHGNVLQVGFILGDAAALTSFAAQQRHIIKDVACDSYGADTLALNTFSDIQKVGIEYNCLPDWAPKLIDGKFYVDKTQIRAIHLTSPYRSLEGFTFKFYYPKLFEKWFDLMEVVELNVIVDNLAFKIRKNWDHTILYHALNDYHLDKFVKLPSSDYAIVDIGAHVGGFTKRAANAFPDNMVYAFEPSPDNFKLLTENTKELKNVRLFNCAVSHYDGLCESFLVDPINRGMDRIRPGNQIKTISIKTLLNNILGSNMVYLLKMDCEGSEWGIIDLLDDKLQERINNIQAELHTDLYRLYEPYSKLEPYNHKIMTDLIDKKLNKFKCFYNGYLMRATRLD